jgi:hypothetical protein
MCALNLVALQRLMQHFFWLWFVKVKEDGGGGALYCLRHLFSFGYLICK